MTRHPPRDSIEARARRNVGRKIGFYIHALVFVLVNLGLYAASELSGRQRPLFIWGWAIGLLIHGVVTFVSLRGQGLRERMIRQEIERMRGDAGKMGGTSGHHGNDNK